MLTIGDVKITESNTEKHIVITDNINSILASKMMLNAHTMLINLRDV